MHQALFLQALFQNHIESIGKYYLYVQKVVLTLNCFLNYVDLKHILLIGCFLNQFSILYFSGSIKNIIIYSKEELHT